MTSHLLFNAALVRWLIIQSWSHAPFRNANYTHRCFSSATQPMTHIQILNVDLIDSTQRSFQHSSKLSRSKNAERFVTRHLFRRKKSRFVVLKSREFQRYKSFKLREFGRFLLCRFYYISLD